MSRVLVGVLQYALADMEQRAQIAIELMDRWDVYRQYYPFDLVIVNNQVEEPNLVSAISKMAKKDYVDVIVNEINQGWAGGRNNIIEYFMNGNWERLILIDQDMYISDETWIKRVNDLIDTDPQLIAYGLSVNMLDRQSIVTLPSGTTAYTMREFLGGVHVFGRKVFETIGGYETKQMSPMWAYCDCLMGRRLKGSGLLKYTFGEYVDPLMVDTEHRNTSHLEPYSVQMHNEMVVSQGPHFSRLEQDALMGRNLYCDYRREKWKDEL